MLPHHGFADSHAVFDRSYSNQTPSRKMHHPGGLQHAWHARLALTRIAPTAYRCIIHLSRAALQRSCASGRPSLAMMLSLLTGCGRPVGRSAARRPERGAHFGKLARTHPLRHPSHRTFLGSRRKSRDAARRPSPPTRTRRYAAHKFPAAAGYPRPR
jgi:hypothetical protein